jgi:hypothetical protein
MTTVIKASCESCGNIQLGPDEVTLKVCTYAPKSYYEFACPHCHVVIHKYADEHVVSLLVGGGVRAEIFEVPNEALEPKCGPPLTYDDLLDFALQLKRMRKVVKHLELEF